MTDSSIRVNIDSSLRIRWQGGPFLAVCNIGGCTNTWADQSEFDRECAEAVADLQGKGKSVLEEDFILSMRATFRAMPNMDPTRYRPASESLIRRCLDKGLFSINPLVDLNNLLSIRLGIPLGIYDMESLPSSTWTYRIGQIGEKYLTFSQQSKNAEGKLVLADELGPFGSPVADSGRAIISGKTSRMAIIAYLPMSLSIRAAEQLGQQVCGAFQKQFHPLNLSVQVIE
jgi:DNA/RNA-binding domain of Phe-tRNA-synthetase-like protein